MTRYASRTLVAQPSIASWGFPAATGIGAVAGYGVATGGSSSSITVSGNAYTLLTFTSTGTLTVSTAGLFDVLLIGGGGGGGNGSDYGYGGGNHPSDGGVCQHPAPAGRPAQQL